MVQSRREMTVVDIPSMIDGFDNEQVLISVHSISVIDIQPVCQLVVCNGFVAVSLLSTLRKMIESFFGERYRGVDSIPQCIPDERGFTGIPTLFPEVVNLGEERLGNANVDFLHLVRGVVRLSAHVFVIRVYHRRCCASSVCGLLAWSKTIVSRQTGEKGGGSLYDSWKDGEKFLRVTAVFEKFPRDILFK
jgi:hypothetical protein